MLIVDIMDLTPEQKEAAESINLVFDQYSGKYSLQVISEGELKIRKSTDDSLILRKMLNFDKEKLHPFNVAFN